MWFAALLAAYQAYEGSQGSKGGKGGGGGGGGGFIGPSSAASSPGGPVDVSPAVYGSGLDGSGWNVNFGGVQSNGPNKYTAPDAPGGLMSAAGIPPMVLYGVLALVAFKIYTKKGA